MQLVLNLDARFGRPFIVVLHTMYSMFEVTSALKSIPPLAGYDVAEFLMGKETLAIGKSGVHTTTFSHTEQTVLVLIPPGARITFDSPGLFDLPLPYRSFKHVDKHLPRNDVVTHGGYESLPLLCLKALYLVTLPTNLQMFLSITCAP